jgi:hypothetical protein
MNQRRIWLVSGLALAALFGLRAADPVPTVPATIAPGGLPVGSLVAFAGAAASVPETQGAGIELGAGHGGGAHPVAGSAGAVCTGRECGGAGGGSRSGGGIASGFRAGG